MTFYPIIVDFNFILIMNCTSWYKSKNLKVPKNIEIMYLPPYLPALNPIEGFWLYIKQNILHNKLYNTIALPESTLCKFITFPFLTPQSNNLAISLIDPLTMKISISNPIIS
ncbi:hypothetical protein GO684_02580 [Wolbachia endosymbiont of Litomosoides brasiliensis]|nr:hypothetical protein [Wolbachia endosymbiont of Litomosoides brasiliensis]